MKPVYIDASTFTADLVRELLPDADERLSIHVGDPDPEAVAALAGSASVLINGHTAMNETLLSRMPALRRIVFLGTGASSYVDLDAAERRGIAVNTISAYGDRSVAEHALALIFAAARQVCAMDRALRAGRWDPLEGMELAGKRLGIVGFGGIGRELAAMASALGMEVAIWNRSPIVDEAWASCQDELDAVLGRSHVVSLHLALNADTRGILDVGRIAAMKPDAILVNTARAGLVDIPALLLALRERRLGHAAFDVFDVEPLPGDDPLVTLGRVTLTAHAGFKTREASLRLLDKALALALANKLAPGRN